MRTVSKLLGYRWFPALVILVALALASLGASLTLGMESSQTPQPDAANFKTHNDLLAEVGEKEPGFGGMFLDSQDNSILYVYSLSPERVREASAAITEIFGPKAVSGREVRVIQAQYSMTQLTEWYKPMSHAVRAKVGGKKAVPGLVGTSIRESENRLFIGVENVEAAQPLIEEILEELGIPMDAVIIQETEPFSLSIHTLQSHIRPLEGGIQFVDEQVGGNCTLSFITIRSALQGFVVPTHCTQNWGEVNHDDIYQPVVAAGNQVGVESVDKAFFTGGSCPAGRECRYSDAAFILTDSSVDINRGYIARPVCSNCGNIAIDHDNPTFRITSDDPNIIAGETVQSVGRTSGWQSGPVVNTCAESEVLGTDYTFLCQIAVATSLAVGDSGAPVFFMPGSGQNVEIFGVASVEAGPIFLAGRIGFIYLELGETATWDTCAPSFSC